MNQTTDQLSPTKRALLALQEMQAKLNALEMARTEPIAVIGMECRFPGHADNVEKFWELLRHGREGTIAVPKERWNIDAYYDADAEKPGKTYTRYGGFLTNIDRFDAPFFGISPREASSMDPQQRLLLEVTWQALENAYIIPERLLGSATGVFIGITNVEYGALALWAGEVERIDAYYGTGGSLGVAAGRLSYILGLMGPSFIVDTACSASLVATHLACQSLRLRECNLALVGGVNLIYGPETFINFSKARMLASDGRCKTFDAAADGYGRGEGCGVLVLKRLTDALAAGDNILALLRGSAVNQDGPSGGLTVPNGPAQEQVIRQALANAGVKPQQINYIEAHGTGTALGDPIEMGALSNVFGKERTPQKPLLVGTVKSNFGHLEAAASIAGIIKVILALQHEAIPPHLHFKQPSPYIDWHNVEVPTTLRPWQRSQEPRLAGVSSFSFSGTNAHIVIEEAPVSHAVRTTATITEERPWHILTLSAKTAPALQQLAQNYQTYLRSTSSALADICFTANTCRSQFKHRLSVIGTSAQHIADYLVAIPDETTPSLARGQVAEVKPKIGFLFTGQGSQYAGMAMQLYATQPLFRQEFDRCDALLKPHLEQSLLTIWQDEALLNATQYTQPALFALEYALAQLWLSLGIIPDAVMGHSVGEYVAACIAGVFSLEDGLKLLAARGRLMHTLCEAGDMLVLAMNESQTLQLLESYQETVAIAALNGQDNTVISGKRETIQTLKRLVEQQGFKTRSLNVSHAFHSPLMKPMLATFEAVAQTIHFALPKIPLCSNVSGNWASGEVANPRYWSSHVLHTVRFADGMETFHQFDIRIFLEIGAKPTLLGMGRQCLPDDYGVWLPSLRPGQNDWQVILNSLGQLAVLGMPINWLNFDQNYLRQRVPLPTYPFQRERYWLETVKPRVVNPEKLLHPLLTRKVISAALDQHLVFESHLSAQTSFLGSHRLFQTAVLPAAAHVELALAAAGVMWREQQLLLTDFLIHQALILPENEKIIIQIVLIAPRSTNEPGVNKSIPFQIYSWLANEERWLLHSSGQLSVLKTVSANQIVDLASWQKQCNVPLATADYYQQAVAVGIEHDSEFQALQEIWLGEGKVLGKVKLPTVLREQAAAFHFHPVLLDGCLQLLGVPLLKASMAQDTYLPVGFDQLQLYRQPSLELWCALTLVPNALAAHLQLFTSEGQLIAQVDNLNLQKANREALFTTTPFQNWYYEIQWQRQPRFGLPATYLPTPSYLATQLTTAVALAKDNLARYETFLPQLEALSFSYLVNAVTQMGWQITQTADDFINNAGVVKQQQRLVQHLISILQKPATSDITPEFEFLQKPSTSDITPEFQLTALTTQYPEFKAELTLLSRCGKALAAVLQGRTDPLELLFPQGDLTILAEFYQQSPGPREMNTLINKVLQEAFANLPPGRGLRLLEIGAGTGGTTAYLLPSLPATQTEYVFTDVSSLFTAQAQAQFAAYSFVRYHVLDIEQSPQNQGFTEPFDVVIAANVLHATQDLNVTLQHIYSLLVPQGTLILLEGIRQLHWVDLTFGLTEGWWRFTDYAVRPDYPLLSITQWQQLLQHNGFKEVAVISPLPKIQAILVAQREHSVAITSSEIKNQPSNRQKEQWLILADRHGISAQVAALLEKQGNECVLVPTEAIKNLSEIVNSFKRLRGILHGWSLNTLETMTTVALHEAQELSCQSTLYLVQALAKMAFTEPPLLVIVTPGVVPVVAEQSISLSHPAAATLWGMGKVIASEFPEWRCVQLDFVPPWQGNEAQAILEEIQLKLFTINRENAIAFRHQQRYVPRLAQLSQPLSTNRERLVAYLRADSSYLITGGLGDLGMLIAQWLVEHHGVKHLILLGRSGAKPKVIKQLQALEQLGATLNVFQADVTDYTQMVDIFNRIAQSPWPLRGVIHAAGVLDDGMLTAQTWERLDRVMMPKVLGAWNLHLLTATMPLDFFLLFSSVAAILGTPGQANHVAANTFLDALAHYRQQQGLAGLSINWGAWAEIGEAARRQADDFVKLRGIGTLQPQQGLQVLEQLLTQPLPQIGVLPIDWSQFLASREVLPFFAAFQDKASVIKQQYSDAEVVKHLKSLSVTERQEYLLQYVQTQVANILGFQAEQLDVQQGFFDLGMDSLTSVELRNRLQKNLDCALPSTVLFKYPTIVKLVEYLAKDVLVMEDKAETTVTETTTTVAHMNEEAMLAMIEEEFEALGLKGS